MIVYNTDEKERKEGDILKILLTAINAKFIHLNPAVYSLKEYASDTGADIAAVEYTINQTTEQILAGIFEQHPDVVAFSCYIWNWHTVRLLLQEIPKIMPDTELWLGGPEVSYDAEKVLETYPQVSGIMIGEGEATFRELCMYWQKDDTNLVSIAGLYLRENGYTAYREPMEMDRLPFIYHNLRQFTNRILYYETSRGCPFRCSYCLSSIEKDLRFRSLEIVYRELDFFLENSVKQVKFVDRTFNCNHHHCYSIWKYLKEHDNGVTNFHFEIAADLLNDEEIELLGEMRPGLVQLEIGVQSTKAETLSAVRRKTDIGKLTAAVKRIREKGNIHIHLDLIAGLPEESLTDFQKSFNDVYRIGCDDLQLGFLKVLKGSYMHERAATYGIRYHDEPPYEILSTHWLGFGDILELKRVEHMLETFHNSNQYERMLRQMEKEFKEPYQFFRQLAEFCRREGYEENQPSREEKFNILLRFAVAHNPEYDRLYRELLVFDIYSRENCKRRPTFAADLTAYKAVLHEFTPYRDSHTEPFFYRVWDEDPSYCGPEPVFITFDYLHRDPRTNNAAYHVNE